MSVRLLPLQAVLCVKICNFDSSGLVSCLLLAVNVLPVSRVKHSTISMEVLHSCSMDAQGVRVEVADIDLISSHVQYKQTLVLLVAFVISPMFTVVDVNSPVARECCFRNLNV